MELPQECAPITHSSKLFFQFDDSIFAVSEQFQLQFVNNIPANQVLFVSQNRLYNISNGTTAKELTQNKRI